MIALVGHGGSGKDTLLKIYKNFGFNTIVSYTTRPIRHNEINGIHYHYITKDDFLKRKKEGFFSEHIFLDGINNGEKEIWHYGVAKQDCDENAVVVVELNGLRQLKKVVDKVFTIYIRACDITRLNRMKSRGDERKELLRRFNQDAIDFEKVLDICDFIIDNEKDMSEYENYIEMENMIKRSIFEYNKFIGENNG